MKLRISIIIVVCVFMCSCGVEKTSVKNTLKPTNKIENSTNTNPSASVAEKSDGTTVISKERIHIKDNRIISIDDLYEKEEKLIIPEGVTGIDATALKYKKKEHNEQGANFTTSQTLHICFSNQVKFKEKNFVGAGPLDISFEEGREKIDRNVFREAGCNGRCFKVTLPNSCKVIEEYAFYDYQGKLQLNEGLERIETYALSRTTCDLPNSVEYLGEHALEQWSPKKYTSTSKTADIKNFRLPSSLKYIGDECIELANMYPSNIVVIPKNVEKIGKNAFKYLTYADVPKKRMPHVRYKVAKGNKWFYSDKDGEIHKIRRKKC